MRPPFAKPIAPSAHQAATARRAAARARPRRPGYPRRRRGERAGAAKRQGRGTGREVALRAQKETPRNAGGDGFVSGLPLVAGPLTAARDCAPTDCAQACACSIASAAGATRSRFGCGPAPARLLIWGLPTPAHAQPSVPPVGRAVPCPLPRGLSPFRFPHCLPRRFPDCCVPFGPQSLRGQLRIRHHAFSRVVAPRSPPATAAIRDARVG